MRNVLDNKQNIPYSLHDMYITEFDVITTDEGAGNNKGILEFCFDNGVIETKPPYNQTDRMKIRIDGVDIDSCDVLLIYDDYADESESRTVSGKRVRIESLKKEYPDFNIEVVTELYGYNKVQYSGYLNAPGEERLVSVDISIYYEGDIVYLTEN